MFCILTWNLKMTSYVRLWDETYSKSVIRCIFIFLIIIILLLLIIKVTRPAHSLSSGLNLSWLWLCSRRPRTFSDCFWQDRLISDNWQTFDESDWLKLCSIILSFNIINSLIVIWFLQKYLLSQYFTVLIFHCFGKDIFFFVLCTVHTSVLWIC